MRLANIAQGVAVLLITIGFGGHLLRHIFAEVSRETLHSPAAWAGISAVAVVAVLSGIGGCLLLTRHR